MIAFIILHFQAIEETNRCVESIQFNVAGEKKIIIVDNASPNQSGPQLKKYYEEDTDVLVLLNGKNEGFARGNNIGYKECKKYHPDFIVVLNSDTLILQPNFADRITEAFSKYQFDVLGPDIISTKTRLHQNPQRDRNFNLHELEKKRRWLIFKNANKWAVWLKYALSKSKTKNIKSNNNHTDIQIGKVLHGAFYVFSRKFIEKHSCCFYDNTFMYYESYILHYLGMKEDMVFLYYPAIQVFHIEDASTDFTYRTQYRKSVWTNRCLLDSCTEFIRLQKDKTVKLQ